MKFQNPIISGFYPDPSICRVGADYFLVTSSFEYFPGVPIFKSQDLIHWKQIGHCLTRKIQIPLDKSSASKGIYAPTLRHHKGRFYMVTTNVVQGGNFMVYSDNPSGEWSDPIWLDQGGIDPSLFFDDDGKVYLTTSTNDQSEIDISTGKRLTEIRKTWDGTGGGFMEAPHIYKHLGFYYLLVAEGGTGRGHMVNIARSKSPWGPFEPCPENPILTNRARAMSITQCVGHGDLVEAPDGKWWMVFLGVREKPGFFPRVHNLGRETFLAPVQWNKDGWPVVNGDGTVQNLEIDADIPPSIPVPGEPPVDDFDSSTLRFSWNFIRNPNPDDWSLTNRPGFLMLHGSAVTLSDESSPAFLGRRQTHDECTFTTLIDFEPGGSDEAGLTVLMNHRHHYEIAIATMQGRKCILVRRRIGDLDKIVFCDEAPKGPVRLSIKADKTHYHFSFAQGNSEMKTVAKGETRYLSTEVAHGFTGVYFGLYATGNGQRSISQAYFDWVEHRTN